MEPENGTKLARWQGTVEAELRGLGERTSDLERTVHSVEQTLVKVQVQLASLKTQVGIWSAIGGVLGAGIATAVGVLVGGH